MIYQWVHLAPQTQTSLDKIYGPAFPGPILLPVGERGEDILKRARQSEAERRECRKRGAE